MQMWGRNKYEKRTFEMERKIDKLVTYRLSCIFSLLFIVRDLYKFLIEHFITPAVCV